MKERFAKAIESIKAAVLADGRVDLGETAVMLRLVRPYAAAGIAKAIELEQMIRKVREDGVITREESAMLTEMLENMGSNGPLLLEQYVRTIPDFPKPGVMFRDVTGIVDNAEGFNLALHLMHKALHETRVDMVVAPESRGFIFGAALAGRLGLAFAPIRKPGKLPRATISEDYELEYGKATLEMHSDAVIRGERVVFVDDLLATGGTAAAGARLVERMGGKVVKMLFPIELEGFGARQKALAGYDVFSLIKYPGK